MNVATCPTCSSTIDPAHGSVARIRGTRVVTFCSAECAAAPAGTVIERKAPGAPPPPSVPMRIEPEPSAFVEELADEVGGSSPAGPAKGRPVPWDAPQRTQPGRRGLALVGLAAVVLLGGIIVVAVDWVGSAEPRGRTTEAAQPAPQPAPAAAIKAPTPAADEKVDIDPQRLYERATEQLRTLTGSRSVRVRRIAALALARTKDNKSVAQLHELLAAENSILVRVEIAYGLARAGDDKGRAVLIESLKSRKRDARLDAARSLVRLGDNGGAKVLLGMLSYKHYRIGAAGLLARLGNPKGVEVLRQARKSPKSSAAVKMRATVALGRAGDMSVRERLTEILEDGRYQVGAADALAALGDKAAVAALTRQLEVDAFRVPAALGLRRLGVEVDLEPLAMLLHAGGDVVRVTSAEAIILLTGPEALAELD